MRCHLVVVLIFILLALGLLIHDGLLGLVGATTRAGRLPHDSRNTYLVSGAEARYWAGAAPSPWLRRRDGCETSVTSGSNHPFSVL